MRQRRFTFDDDPSEEPLVNLTPLIDVVFVVLISFILIAPMLEIDNVNLAVGAADTKKSAAAPEPAALTIVVKKDNSIWIRGALVAVSDLEKTLRLVSSKTTPQIIHDRDASFGTYQSIKNALERCGFEQMDLVLKPN